MCAGEVYIPYDANKVSDHDHGIYREGPYGFGHFATMDASSLTIDKGIIRQRSGDRSLMPWHDPRFIHHYENIDTQATSYKDAGTGTCFEIPADALRNVVFEATRKIAKGEAGYRYAIVESLGASNVNDARQEFLREASEAGICSIVVSQVKGATDVSPYAAGAKSSTNVTVVSPDTVYDHTRGKFYVAAAWTEYVLEKYGIEEKAAHEIRPLLFRELYQRQRGYGEPFIPGSQNRSATSIQDHALQLWARSQRTESDPSVAPA